MFPCTEIHFWHIPKTAGTSVAGLIRRAYLPEECIPAHTVRELVAMPRGDVPKYRCYTGHCFHCSLRSPLPPVTILRDPVRQSLSLLRHCQRHVPGASWVAPVAAQALEFAWENIPASRRSIEKEWCPVLLNNFQTRVLGCDIRMPCGLKRGFHGMTYPFLDPAFCDPSADMEAIYERAVARLESMAVVGTVKRLAETVARICELLGVTDPADLPRSNMSPTCAEPSPDFLEPVESQNTYDRKLHQLAARLR